jgi:hypothetical protein
MPYNEFLVSLINLICSFSSGSGKKPEKLILKLRKPLVSTTHVDFWKNYLIP